MSAQMRVRRSQRPANKDAPGIKNDTRGQPKRPWHQNKDIDKTNALVRRVDRVTSPDAWRINVSTHRAMCNAGGGMQLVDAKENVGAHRGGCAMVSARACFVASRGDKRGTYRSSRTSQRGGGPKLLKSTEPLSEVRQKVLILDSDFRK